MFNIITSVSLSDHLKTLLSEPSGSALVRERLAFDQMAFPFSGNIVVFGCGFLGRRILGALRKNGIEPLAFSDNNESKWWHFFDGLQVLPPAVAASRFGDSAAFVVTIWVPHHSFLQTKNQLSDLGCKIVVPFQALMWRYPEDLLPHFHFEPPHAIIDRASDILKAFTLLYDEESRRQYVAQIRWRLLLDYDGLPHSSPHDQYFPDDVISLSFDEYMVDGGAFDGDTIKSFISRRGSCFARIIAFEPDPSNYDKLVNYVSTLEIAARAKIDIVNAAVGSHGSSVRFDATGGTNAAVNEMGSIEVPCVALDEHLSSDTPTFLKFDIEGAELDALAGASATIRRARPTLAISVYHRPRDLWEIPLYVRSQACDYRFFLRSHDEDGHELVCYAVSPSRVPDHPLWI